MKGMEGGDRHRPVDQREARPIFTLTDQEEKDLNEVGGGVLRHRRTDDVLVGQLIVVEGEAGLYEVYVERVQPTKEGFEDTDTDFVVSLTRRPANFL